MKKSIVVLTLISSLFIINSCADKEPIVINNKTANNINKNSDRSDLVVEVKPAIEEKAKVVTKVKPEVNIIEAVEKKPNELPVVVVEPIEANNSVDIDTVEILPSTENTIPIITKVKPTVEIEEEIPAMPIVIDPIIEE